MACPKDADTGPEWIGKGCLSRLHENYCTRNKHKYGKHHSHVHGKCEKTWTDEELILEAL